MKKKGTTFLIQSAIIAALYTVLTLVLIPFSYGVMQVRVSEALTVLPFFTSAAVPGLFVGCLLANLIGPNGLIDVICGSLATLLAAIASYRLRGKPALVPLPPVLANGIIIGPMLHYVIGVPVPLWGCVLWVAFGELIACYGVGFPLMKYLSRYKGFTDRILR